MEGRVRGRGKAVYWIVSLFPPTLIFRGDGILCEIALMGHLSQLPHSHFFKIVSSIGASCPFSDYDKPTDKPTNWPNGSYTLNNEL